jgi:F420H(2)-dependent quinone reductase
MLTVSSCSPPPDARPGNVIYDAVATPTEDDERARLWTMLKETYPFFVDYEIKTDRTILSSPC